MQFGLLFRCLAVTAMLGDPLIPAIGKSADRLWQRRSALAKEREIVRFPVAESRREYLARLFIGHKLRFLSVSLLFTAVVVALFFFGRSQGHSVASIRTTSITVSLS